jgi:hypothetical protein
VQPSSAQVRVSPKARTIGSAPAARLPLRLSTTMLGFFPHPSRANSSRPRLPLAGRPRYGRIGSVAARRVLLPCGAGRGGWARLAGRGPKAQPHRADAWSAARPGRPRPASPDRRAGRGVQGPASPRSAAVDPGPGGRLDAGELFAWVGGSSVSLTCSCADQGGCHVDMVVGADHRGRCRVGVRRDAEPSPLTAPLPARSRLELLLDQADGLAAWPVRPGPAGAADPQRCPARRARVPARYCQPFSRSNTRETRRSNVVVEPGRPRGEASTRGQAVRATRRRPVAPGRESPQDPRHTPRRPSAGTPRPDRLREGP